MGFCDAGSGGAGKHSRACTRSTPVRQRCRTHPTTLHGGEALETVQARQETLDAAYSVWPERFRNGPPRAARPPKEAWINKPVIATTL